MTLRSAGCDRFHNWTAPNPVPSNASAACRSGKCPNQAMAAVLRAGMDSECTWGANVIHDNLLPAIMNGSVPRENATAALTHLFKVQFR